MGSNRCAYEHAVKENYISDSSGDDQEKFPTSIVAHGDASEPKVSTDDCPSGAQDNPTDLSTQMGETQISSDHATTFLFHDDVCPGGDGGLETGKHSNGPLQYQLNAITGPSRAIT